MPINELKENIMYEIDECREKKLGIYVHIEAVKLMNSYCKKDTNKKPFMKTVEDIFLLKLNTVLNERRFSCKIKKKRT